MPTRGSSAPHGREAMMTREQQALRLSPAPRRQVRWRRACTVVALATLACAGIVQEVGAQALSGTLKKIRDRGTITLGIRENSFPFSYLDARGEPVGYSIDLCLAIVDAVRTELQNDAIKVAYVPVTPADRIAKVIDGSIDLECGSTTNNLERQKQVAFSPVFFVSGTKLLVRRTTKIKNYLDLRNRTVVVTEGTTNEKALRTLADREKIDIKFAVSPDHSESFRRLEAGEAAAFATDDVLLYGFIARSKHEYDYSVVGDFLSYDAYGLMFRKDDADFADLVLTTFQTMAANRDLADLYDKWFVRKLATGERLGLRMGPQLESIFEVLGQPTE
jgi:glutamate/aspartate transport system substrate-binding protein